MHNILLFVMFSLCLVQAAQKPEPVLSSPSYSYTIKSKVNYIDFDANSKSMYTVWDYNAADSSSIIRFYLTKDDVVPVQELHITPHESKLVLNGWKTYRQLATHHFREYIFNSILQLEDFRVWTVFGLTGQSLSFTDLENYRSDAYNRIVETDSAFVTYSHRNVKNKNIHFKDMQKIGSLEFPLSITIDSRLQDWVTAHIQTYDIRFRTNERELQFTISESPPKIAWDIPAFDYDK